MSRTAQQIVDQTEKIARRLVLEFYPRYELDLQGAFWESKNPILIQCWNVACELQKELTDTIPEDTIQERDLEEVIGEKEKEIRELELKQKGTQEDIKSAIFVLKQCVSSLKAVSHTLGKNPIF